jgi:hypothetical protein
MRHACIHCNRARRFGWTQVVFTADCRECEAVALALIAPRAPASPPPGWLADTGSAVLLPCRELAPQAAAQADLAQGQAALVPQG